MAIKWKTKRNLKPEVILQKIDSIKNFSGGGIQFEAFEYEQATSALYTMVDFPPDLTEIQRESILSRAISNVAKGSNLTKDNLIAELKQLVGKERAKKEQKYHMLASLSIAPPLPARIVSIDKCRIRILSNDYPKKFASRNELMQDPRFKHRHNVVEASPADYSKVIVSADAKSPDQALRICLMELDIMRAIWCLELNHDMELMGNQQEPINVIRTGSVHTIHLKSGKLVTDLYWHEPNFVLATPYTIRRNLPVYQKNFKWYLEQLHKSKYSDKLKGALLRYVRALDERDQDVALIRLWGAVESLTSPGEANYDLVTRRCAFLFAEHDYHKQILEHLREYRNQSVHAGEQMGKAKIHCYQLQFYFRQLILFHLRFAGKFDNLDQANEFLDLPFEKKSLEARKELIELAIKFVT